MKGLFITIAFALFLSTTLSAQPYLDYSVARRDADPFPGHPIVPGSVWGDPNTGLGMGTKWCFPNNGEQGYNGICVWRITDASVFSGGAAVQIPDNDADNSPAVQTTDNQKDNITSALNGEHRYVVVRSTGGTSWIVDFDSAQSTATKAGSMLTGEMMFDETNPGIIYAKINHTQIQKYTSTSNNGMWNTYTASAIYDFANCLPQGFQAKWNGAWATDLPDTHLSTGAYHVWGSAFSEGDQGTGHWAVAYKESSPPGGPGGCASIDTQGPNGTLNAYGWNGVYLGPLDDGNGNLLTQQFTMHEGSMTRIRNSSVLRQPIAARTVPTRIHGK